MGVTSMAEKKLELIEQIRQSVPVKELVDLAGYVVAVNILDMTGLLVKDRTDHLNVGTVIKLHHYLKNKSYVLLDTRSPQNVIEDALEKLINKEVDILIIWSNKIQRLVQGVIYNDIPYD